MTTLTPKEKAKELSMKFDKYGETDNAKQCALMAIDEILLSWKEDGNKRLDVGIIYYWEQVKKEIEKI